MIAIIAILAGMLLPSLAKAKQKAQGVYCLNNTKQLMVANTMYQGDNRDCFPMAMHGGYVPTATDKVKPWVTGWLDWQAGNNDDNTNTTYLVNPLYAVLATYFAQSRNIYKCPADIYLSKAQAARGWKARVRSVSGNIYVGLGNAWAKGSWGDPNGPNNLTIYRGVAKASELLIPGPSLTWVYMDEHPDSINDAGAFAPDTATNIPDAPATYHNGACGFSFADGHSEIHKWRGPTMTKGRNVGGLRGVNYIEQNNFGTVKRDPDLYFYSFATPRQGTKTAADL